MDSCGHGLPGDDAVAAGQANPLVVVVLDRIGYGGPAQFLMVIGVGQYFTDLLGNGFGV
jgi:hypothetical protein